MIDLITGHSGTRHVSAEAVGAYNAGIVGEETYILRGCEATRIDNNHVQIGEGDMLVQGRHVHIPAGAPESVFIENGSAGLYRIDYVCLHYTKGSDGIESVELSALKGRPSSGTPVAPSVPGGSILDGDSEATIPLFSVSVNGTEIDEIVLAPNVKILSSMVEMSDVLNIVEALSRRNEDAISGLQTTTADHESRLTSMGVGKTVSYKDVQFTTQTAASNRAVATVATGLVGKTMIAYTCRNAGTGSEFHVQVLELNPGNGQLTVVYDKVATTAFSVTIRVVYI